MGTRTTASYKTIPGVNGGQPFFAWAFQESDDSSSFGVDGLVVNDNTNAPIFQVDRVKGLVTASLLPRSSPAAYGSSTPLTTAKQTLFVGASGSGATSVTAPAAADVSTGYTFTVVDSGANCSANHITIHGNGVNIEDPNSPGTFSASVVLSVSSAAVTWSYDGTNWKIEFSFYPSAVVTSVSTTAPIGNSGSPTAPIINISAATQLAAGSMSATDKTKLDGIGAGAAVVSVGVTAPIGNSGSSTAPVINISAATALVAGSMSAADKAKSDSFSITSPTKGDILYYDGAHWVNLGAGTPGQVLITQGTSSPPGWGTTSAGSTSKWITRPILAGVTSTQNGSGSPLRVGSLLFKPGDEASTAVRKVWLRAVLETTGASYQANIALVDVNNVLGNGAGAIVPGSTLSTTATSGTEVEVELNTTGGNLESLVSNVLLYAVIWLTTTLAGQSVTCSGAALYVQG